MKRNIIPTLALILACLSLVVSCLALALVPEDQTHLIDDLYRENHRLSSRVDELTALLEQQQTTPALASLDMSVIPWEDYTGADILITAAPAAPIAGGDATLEVLLDGQRVSGEVCVWDGTHFTATVSLSAADGYSYYLILPDAGGNRTLPLSTPEAPVFDTPVYLQSSLSAYCNLVVSDWTYEAGTLVLRDAHAQIQLPQVGDLSILQAQLVLQRDGSDAVRMDVAPQHSEVPGSFTARIRDLSLPVGTVKDGDTMALYLEVTLSDGRNLSVFGISWSCQGDTLSSAVG